MCPPRSLEPVSPKSGEPENAINFALSQLEPWEVYEFLKDWRDGNLDAYPEYIDWLAETSVKGDNNE